MRNNSTIEFDSAEFNAMFTPDGKLDFNARRGMKREDDPLDRVNYGMEPPNFVTSERRSANHSLRYDDDVDINEDW